MTKFMVKGFLYLVIINRKNTNTNLHAY